MAELLLQVSSAADALAERLNGLLKDESESRTKAIRERQSFWKTVAKQDMVPTFMDTLDFGNEKPFRIDGGDDDEAAGNAPVPAFPRRPVPVLAGGAARRFEESDEPPRNP